EQGPTMRGLLVAAPREPVLDSVRAVERAGLRVKHVDLASFAALRAVGRVNGVVEAILDLGRTATTLVVHRDGVPSIVRALPHGGAEVTELLAKRMALSLEAAEALKREIRIDTGPGAHSRLGAGDESDDGPQALAQAVRPLIAETRNSLSYHASLHPEWTVNRILLCGGGAALLGLTELFSHEFGVPVDTGDPLQRLPGSSDGCAPATSAVAVGLALRAVA
ncbi:MAG: pilM, partial [Jatrophihabitantaceae bacterium]|nr:pilM [Jatrophihabitantaceae bacterium]